MFSYVYWPSFQLNVTLVMCHSVITLQRVKVYFFDHHFFSAQGAAVYSSCCWSEGNSSCIAIAYIANSMKFEPWTFSLLSVSQISLCFIQQLCLSKLAKQIGCRKLKQNKPQQAFLVYAIASLFSGWEEDNIATVVGQPSHVEDHEFNFRPFCLDLVLFCLHLVGSLQVLRLSPAFQRHDHLANWQF